jgi:hypothetical protein
VNLLAGSPILRKRAWNAFVSADLSHGLPLFVVKIVAATLGLHQQGTRGNKIDFYGARGFYQGSAIRQSTSTSHPLTGK